MILLSVTVANPWVQTVAAGESVFCQAMRLVIENKEIIEPGGGLGDGG